jgi:hypothetical protein
MLKCAVVFTGLMVVAASRSDVAVVAQQRCLHGAIESSAEKLRRDQALRWAFQVNLAERAFFAPGLTQKYRPLAELRNVPPVPEGFGVQFHTDGQTYMFSLKDTLDPCGYALFSDQAAQVYELTPIRRPVVVPVTQ